MSRRQRGLSPTLFPFLAVLVCTLGTLILLLALVAQNATATSTSTNNKLKKVDSGQTLSQTQIKQLIREEDFRLEALISMRNSQTLDIESQREERTHLEDHIQRIKEKIQQLQKEVKVSSDGTEAIISEEELASLSGELTRIRQTVAELREQAENPDPKVVIVPHKGPNGTDRRAVYLECVSDGILIWPEGSRITKAQLQNSSDSANPLDAALRTIRLHALKVYGDTSAPYPLLVVRPEGIETYAAARKAMKTWDDQFGYELVESQTTLEFPSKDEVLKKRIDEVVLEASRRQTLQDSQRLARASTLLNHNKVEMQPKNLPTLSAAAMERSSRASGYRQMRAPSQPISGFQTQRNALQGGELNEFVPNKNNQDSHQNAPTYPNRERQSQHRMPSPSKRNSVTVTPSPNRPSYTSPYEGSPNRPDLASKDSKPPSNRGSNNLSKSQTQNSKSDTAGHSSSPELQVADEIKEDFSPDRHAMDENGNRHADAGGADAGGADAGGAGNSEDAKESASSNIENVALDNVSKGSSQMINPLSQADSGGSSSSIGSAMQSPQELMGQREDRIETQQQIPEVDVSLPKSLIQKTGRHWAIPQAVSQMRGNAIIRIMRVELYDDRVILMPSRNATSIEVFSFFDGNLERASMQLAAAIYQRIEQWGPALPGAKWQPALEVTVAASQLQTFELLRNHLSGSGLSINREEPK